MNETNEKAQISLHKITLLVGIMQRQISIEEAIASEDAEKVRILSIAQNIDINELRRYLYRFQEKIGMLNTREANVVRENAVRGAIIGALAGGHMDGQDGASYSKNVLYQIADLLDIELPEIVKRK